MEVFNINNYLLFCYHFWSKMTTWSWDLRPCYKISNSLKTWAVWSLLP